MGKEVPWTFKTWLKNFEAVDLPIGDLARDAAKDPDFPSEDMMMFFIEHLEEKNACSSAIEAFANAWNFYKASTGEVGTLAELTRRTSK